MKTVREMADPHLHALRMVVRSIKKKDKTFGHQLETARFKLFGALEHEDYSAAVEWLNTLEAGLACLEADKHPAAQSVAKALSGLREVLEEETEVVPESSSVVEP